MSDKSPDWQIIIRFAASRAPKMKSSARSRCGSKDTQVGQHQCVIPRISKSYNYADIGSVTILWSQPIGGLQILSPDGSWRWVRHMENALVSLLLRKYLTDIVIFAGHQRGRCLDLPLRRILSGYPAQSQWIVLSSCTVMNKCSRSSSPLLTKSVSRVSECFISPWRTML